jgi:hypothetical protein
MSTPAFLVLCGFSASFQALRSPARIRPAAGLVVEPQVVR